MKKLSLYIFLVLMWCNIGYANNFNYVCSFETHFKNADLSEWKFKTTMKFKIYNSGNSLKFYDYETQYESDGYDILINNQNEVVALKNLPDRIETLVINKKTLFAKYQNMYFDNEGGGEYSIGKCYK
ncbi:hypothetical protein OA095_03330 [Candidatus Pelagibacter sp.]|nr:hypothetical protein [Candidatus Pelagibacter sp.]